MYHIIMPKRWEISCLSFQQYQYDIMSPSVVYINMVYRHGWLCSHMLVTCRSVLWLNHRENMTHILIFISEVMYTFLVCLFF